MCEYSLLLQDGLSGGKLSIIKEDSGGQIQMPLPLHPEFVIPPSEEFEKLGLRIDPKYAGILRCRFPNHVQQTDAANIKIIIDQAIEITRLKAQIDDAYEALEPFKGLIAITLDDNRTYAAQRARRLLMREGREYKT